MIRPSQVLVFLCFAAVPVFAPVAGAADDAVVAQELRNVRASSRIASAVWTRRPDSYTLQVVYAQSPCERLSYERQTATRTAPAPAVSPSAADVDRNSFFIGSAIGSLRGLDPTMGGCTLALTDGRRAAQSGSGTPGTSSPAAASKPPTATAPSAPAVIQVWLLKSDGSQLLPTARYSPSPSEQGCGSRCQTNEVLYRFPLAEAPQVVAVAISVDGELYIEKLESLDPAG